jgi:hypothetical protein
MQYLQSSRCRSSPFRWILQTIIEQIFATSRYERKMRYHDPVDSPLGEAEADFLRKSL